MKFRGIIFDLDGTLVDSLADIAGAMNILLERYNMPSHSIDSYRYFIGEGLEHLVKTALPENERSPEKTAQYTIEYRQIYREHCLDTTKPYEGINELLKQLWSRHIPTQIKKTSLQNILWKASFPDIALSQYGERWMICRSNLTRLEPLFVQKK